MACMSQHEWQDLVTLTMTLSQVNAIADFAGTHNPGAPDKPGLHSRDWACCPGWQPGRNCRGWFDNETGFLVDKNVVNR